MVPEEVAVVDERALIVVAKAVPSTIDDIDPFELVTATCLVWKVRGYIYSCEMERQEISHVEY